MRQENNESLKAFVGRFNREALQLPSLDPSAAMNALPTGARSNDFRRSIARKNPSSLADLMTEAKEYISVEETLAALNMFIGEDRLKLANSDLFGFSGEIIKLEGSIELPVLVGEPPLRAFAMVTFLVVRATSAYNAILGRPGQNLLRAIASAYHQKAKFITPGGLGEVLGDQPQSTECYVTALNGKGATEMLPIELLDLRDDT
ncbi:uncharacterized protein LOC143890951 [Tasmannia lanceolata]|uniref:uncharacterized protein LOC143890951 n=1 Tax=Tasmannia lanceolata TaxID=3420 RepID=UPI004064A022